MLNYYFFMLFWLSEPLPPARPPPPTPERRLKRGGVGFRAISRVVVAAVAGGRESSWEATSCGTECPARLQWLL